MKTMTLPQRILLGLFVLVGFVVAVNPIVPEEVTAPLHWADACLMLLAAANVLLAVIRRDGRRDAFISLSIVIAGAGLVTAMGAATGRPFGPYEYTPNLGPRIMGVLPIAVPFLWYAVIASGHYLVFHFAKLKSRRLTALAVAACVALFDLLFEPFAAFVKSYWLWKTAEIPSQNYVAWFVAAFVLVRIAPFGRGPIDRFDPRPAVVALTLLVICAVSRIATAI